MALFFRLLFVVVMWFLILVPTNPVKDDVRIVMATVVMSALGVMLHSYFLHERTKD